LGAVGCGRNAPTGRRRGKELVDLEQPLFDRDDLGRLLVHQILPKAILAVHLQHQTAEVADVLLAKPQQVAALAAQEPCRWEGTPPRRGLCARLRLLHLSAWARAAEAFEQRRHAGESN
jgi:hypothetical protein